MTKLEKEQLRKSLQEARYKLSKTYDRSFCDLIYPQIKKDFPDKSYQQLKPYFSAPNYFVKIYRQES